MQDIDRPAEIQALPEPAGARRARMEAKTKGVVMRAERRDGIAAHGSSRRHLGQRAAIRPLEPERPVGGTRDPVALLVHRAVMPATEQREVRERGGPAVRPVAEVMPLGEADAAAREAAAPVPMEERPPQGGRNGAGPGPDLDHAALLVMAHHHPARVARQAPRRFRGNARAVLEDALTGLLRIGQHGGIDVDHHLVALARGAGIEVAQG